MASWWDDFTDTAGKTIRTGWRGAVHIGGGVGNGMKGGLKWGLITAAVIGIAITAALTFGIPAIAAWAGMSGTYAMSIGGALTTGALLSVPAVAFLHGPHPAIRGLGVAGLVAGAAIATTIAGPLTLFAGAVGAAATALSSTTTVPWMTGIGGALGGISRIFNWPKKEVERETVIEQHKVLDARQENQQVSEHEAQQAARLEDVQRRAQEQKAARFQMHNPIAQENGGSKILEKQKDRQTEIGTNVPVAAMG